MRYIDIFSIILTYFVFEWKNVLWKQTNDILSKQLYIHLYMWCRCHTFHGFTEILLKVAEHTITITPDFKFMFVLDQSNY